MVVPCYDWKDWLKFMLVVHGKSASIGVRGLVVPHLLVAW